MPYCVIKDRKLICNYMLIFLPLDALWNSPARRGKSQLLRKTETSLPAVVDIDDSHFSQNSYGVTVAA